MIARFGALGCLEPGENATGRPIGGVQPSPVAMVGRQLAIRRGLEAVMHDRHMSGEVRKRLRRRAGRQTRALNEGDRG
jgi:preprotein translocase subunit SecA